MRFVGPVNSAQNPLVCTIHTEKSTITAPKKKKKKEGLKADTKCAAFQLSKPHLNSELRVLVQFSFSFILIFFAILSKLNSELRDSVIDFHLDLDLIIE